MKTVRNVKTLVDTVSTVKRQHKELKDWRESRKKIFKISIKETDELFYDIQSWLVTLPSSKNIYEWSVSSQRYTNKLRYAYNGEDYHYVDWNKINLGFSVEVDKATNDNDESGGRMSFLERVLILKVGSQSELNKLKEKLNEISISRKKKETPPKIRIFSRWGWDQSEAPLRDLSSVVLREDIKEKISKDIGRFLSEEEAYLKKGIPWHRGILLHGPPGTGKTSLVKGLAKEHGLDIYYVSLSDIKSDTELLDKMHEVSPKSIVLMEDVDSSYAAKGDDTNNGVTTSGLLNVLDGLFTPYGMICILTTNFPEKLAPAIVRPGRIDLKVMIGYCDSYQVNELYYSFYGIRTNEFDVSLVEISSAEVTEIFKRNLYNAEVAKKELKDFIFTKTLEKADL